MPVGTIGWVIGAGIGKGDGFNSRDHLVVAIPTSTAVTRPTAAPTARTQHVGVGRKTATHVRSTVFTKHLKRVSVMVSTKRPSEEKVTVLVADLRVHTAPSLSAAVLGVTARNRHLTVLALINQWVKVRLPNHTSGWISRSYTSLQRTGPVQRSTTPVSRLSVVTANVRLHTRPTLTSSAIRLIATGTHLQVLSVVAGWTKARLASHQFGYVRETYVKQ